MIIALAALLFALGTPSVPDPAGIAALRAPGTALPDVALPLLDGGTLRLRSLVGRPSVLVVFASWCDPCRADMPSVIRSAARNPDATFIGIDELESAQLARGFVRRQRIAFKTVLLTTGAFARNGVSDEARAATGIDIPAVYVLDRRGIVVRSFIGGDPAIGTKVDTVLRSLRAPYAVLRAVPEPELFAEGIVSTPDDESGGSFSPDGTQFYFLKSPPYTLAPRLAVICVSRFTGGAWSKPEIVPFSGRYLDFPPHLSPDGSALYFASSRRLPGSERRGIRIWVARRAAGAWSEPVPLPAPINADDSWSIDPSVTRDGTLYFASNRGDARGHFHIFRARRAGDGYETPVALGPEINSAFNDVQPFIAPDESLLLFASVGTFDVAGDKRPEELIAGGSPYPREDLYVSRNRGGRFTPAQHLAHGINTFAADSYPSVTPDGRYLFFSSERSAFEVPTPHRIGTNEFETTMRTTLDGLGNIYFVDVSALEPAG